MARVNARKRGNKRAGGKSHEHYSVPFTKCSKSSCLPTSRPWSSSHRISARSRSSRLGGQLITLDVSHPDSTPTSQTLGMYAEVRAVDKAGGADLEDSELFRISCCAPACV